MPAPCCIRNAPPTPPSIKRRRCIAARSSPAFQNVADALHAVQSDAETLKAAVAAERAAFKSLEIARRQLQLGAIGYLGLLTAQNTYQMALIALVQAQAARYADTAALFQALGGGWWNRQDVTPAKTWDIELIP